MGNLQLIRVDHLENYSACRTVLCKEGLSQTEFSDMTFHFYREENFFAFGQLTEIGLLQGSSGPKFFSENCCGLHTP